MQQVSHLIGLNGIGGVQRNFIEYLKNINPNQSNFKHVVYTIGEVDKEYSISVDTRNIKKIKNFKLLVGDIMSKKIIVHFYNNLSSLKVAFVLFFIPARRLIIHERGTAWNQPVKRSFFTRFNARKASVVLSNSKATKSMLVEKFFIPEHKITVIYNGIDVNNRCPLVNKFKENSDVFRVGFIGRLDTPKGVHVLIDAMTHLNDNYKLLIAGDGELLNALQKQSQKSKKILFVGRVKNPYDFLKKIDLLVVPSIREPLGNVCLEAGLCKVPVLAANIDGLPEVIENFVSGELISPTDDIVINTSTKSLALPEFVVNPITHKLCKPLQINPKILANKIFDLSLKKDILDSYADQLQKKVVDYFNIKRYILELDGLYKKLTK